MTPQPNRTGKKEIRFAAVMYGGASLAIYINGVAQEILKMARATAVGRTQFDASEKIYRHLAVLLSDEEKLDELAAKPAADIKTEVKKALDEKNFDEAAQPAVRFVVDVLSGTSAGGINAVFLAKALAQDRQMDDLKNLWLKEGDISKLINDKSSIFDNGLNLASEPKSLLNSQRMYLKLLEALNGMDAAAAGENATNCDELDLFVTVTDYTGVPLPLRLYDKVVEESRHKQVFHFKYNPELKDDQLAAKYNPFLAFAARCTSAFPFAFEPMRLADIDAVLEQCFPTETNKSDSALWNEFAIKQKATANGANGAANDWRKRYLVDGGYLDNKPFGYAIDMLARRQAAGLVERKLIYVDPSPELFDNRKLSDAPPDALENLKAAAMDLPRYETIREDLQRLLDRNRLIRRVRNLTRESEKDFLKAREFFSPYNGQKSAPDWEARWLDDIVRQKGECFLPYFRLRVSSVTDDIARLVTQFYKFEQESDYFLAIRYLVRAWRTDHFGDYKPERTALDGSPVKTLNKFLNDYDLDYRLRRLRFVLQKAEELLRDKDLLGSLRDARRDKEKQPSEQIQNVANSAVNNEQGLLSSNVALSTAAQTAFDAVSVATAPPDETQFDNFVAELKTAVVWFQEQLSEIYRDLRRKQLRLQRFAETGGESHKEFFSALKDAEKIITPDELKKVFGDTGDETLGYELIDEQFCRASAAELYQKTREVELPNGETKTESVAAALDNAARQLSAFFMQGIFKPARNQINALLCFEALNAGQTSVTPPPNEVKPEAVQIVRNYLKSYYALFESYDQLSFPIFYQSSVGEAVPVDIVRISPLDAVSLINEQTDADGRRKLAGDSYFAFGAFLDETWRLNDIMWGRLDGAERLITTLLPTPKYAALRQVLIEQAHTEILQDEMFTTANESFRETLAAALVRAKIETPAKAIDKIFARLDEPKIKTGLSRVLGSCLEKETICEQVRENYEVNRRLEPKPLLRVVSRSTQVAGKMFGDISEKHGQSGESVQWITKLGKIFWGLIEVAVPFSFPHELFRHWLKLIYLFEIILLVGSTVLVNTSVQQFGIVAFTLTLTVHLAVLVLHDTMRGKRFVEMLFVLLVCGVLFLAASGAMFLTAFLYNDLAWWNGLTNWRANYLPAYEPWQKLLPVASLAILLVAAVVGRAVRDRSLRFFGWATIVFCVAAAALGTFFRQYPFLVNDIFNLEPMLTLEAVRTTGEFTQAFGDLGSVARENMTTALLVDAFVFVPLYAAFLMILSQLLTQSRRVSLRWLAGVAAVLVFATAVSDSIENYLSLVALNSADLTDGAINLMHYAGIAKWLFLSLSVGILSFAFWERIKNWRAADALSTAANSVFNLLLLAAFALTLAASLIGIAALARGLMSENYAKILLFGQPMILVSQIFLTFGGLLAGIAFVLPASGLQKINRWRKQIIAAERQDDINTALPNLTQ